VASPKWPAPEAAKEALMVERVHEHILSELNQNARTDTVFILTAILLNLITLGVNSAIGRGSEKTPTVWVVFITFIVLVIVVNFVAAVGLLKGKQMRSKLIDGLLKMYTDHGVAEYYDPSILTGYMVRYNLYLLAVAFTGLVALVVPVVLALG
jgi:hypothetical protein